MQRTRGNEATRGGARSWKGLNVEKWKTVWIGLSLEVIEYHQPAVFTNLMITTSHSRKISDVSPKVTDRFFWSMREKTHASNLRYEFAPYRSREYNGVELEEGVK